jgi:hypothetical protein
VFNAYGRGIKIRHPVFVVPLTPHLMRHNPVRHLPLHQSWYLALMELLQVASITPLRTRYPVELAMMIEGRHVSFADASLDLHRVHRL